MWRWLTVLATLALIAGGGYTGYRLGWFDDLIDSASSSGSVVAEPWHVPVPSPAAIVAGTSTPDAARVRDALRGELAAADLGDHLVVEVSGIDGTVLARRGAGAAIPASTTKVLTAAAALHAYGPEATFATMVISPAPGRIVLVGGGDPLLASKPAGNPASNPVSDEVLPRADLVTLAASVAAELQSAGVNWVRLSYDDSLFGGAPTSPTWPDSYVTDDVVSPVSALRVDAGRLETGRDRAPAATAAQTFAAALRAQGIRVGARVRPAAAAATGTELARVTSAPLRDLVQHTLETSDNDAAEVLAHLVGAKAGDGSFAGGVAAMRAALAELGVPLDQVVLHDGSGLSRENRITATALTAVLSRAVRDPDLQSLTYGMPVAGFSGSLTERFADDSAKAGLGVVRAKTGTLTGVSALAGVVTDASGMPLIYVVMADHVPIAKTLAARAALDDAAAALARCHCSVPSAQSSATVGS